MTDVVFRARGLAKAYPMGELTVQALQSVDLDLRAGEFVVILGPSGSGKSTLLNILGGLATPSAGEVTFRDHVLTGASEADLTRYRREHVGFVFQFYNLIPSLTALENVRLVTELASDSPHGARPGDPAEALRLVGLEGRFDHFPAQMSGGEQQRVAIARAIVKRPDVLLCDEPTGALLAQVGEPADLEIVVPLLTADAARVKPGAAVTFTTGAGEAPLHATVTVIEPAAFTKLSPLGVQEQRVNVIARVAGPANGLGDAFRVDARITVQEVRDAVIVPSAALVRHGEAWTAWAVQGGRAMPREVTIGPRARDGVAVRTGLAPGDSVVLYPSETLTTGARVQRGGA